MILRLLCCLCTYCVLSNNFSNSRLYNAQLQTNVSYVKRVLVLISFFHPSSKLSHSTVHSSLYSTQDEEKEKMFRLRKTKVLPQQVSDFGAFLFVVTMIPITYIWEVRTETKMPQWFHSAHSF